ncbi:hypothetical protein J6590_001973 [Homalodisca vitripennis]|nr:hypothetical protein J6590_001973 [Homalodisca vitripennis]
MKGQRTEGTLLRHKELPRCPQLVGRWPSHYCLTVWCDTGNSPRLARSASERIVGANYDLVLRTLQPYDKGYCAANVCWLFSVAGQATIV